MPRNLIGMSCIIGAKRTGWERLLQLLDLLAILQDQGVQVTLASDLELDNGGLLVALDACSYFSISPASL